MRTPSYARYFKSEGRSFFERMMRGIFGRRDERFADRSPELKAQLLDSAQDKRIRRARSRLYQAERGGMMIHTPDVVKKRKRSRKA